jgi:hypothetical protein
MKADLNRLIDKPPAEKRLDTPATPQPIRAKTGLERRQLGEVNSEEVTAVSTDGLFTFVVRVVKT